MDTIGKRLRAARETQGYTVHQLHELTRLTEEETIGFEADRWFPPISALVALQNPLKCSIEWLLLGKAPVKNSLYSSQDSNEILLSKTEFDLVSMFRLLNEHDQQCAFDIITMLYEQAAGVRTSAYTACIDGHK